ncbi:MAG TPA: hypothetical protein VK918_00710, partial [Pyrinomonadaceae bacterium]|nr:hypothetical protein [Pyrinomonadaceae bacterium]
GKALFFATAMTMGGIATGLLARSYEGRPVKLEGNPDHPGSLGTTDVFSQAALLDMYDPDRSQQVMFRGGGSSWQGFSTAMRTAIEENRADGGAGIRFLTPTVTSPTLQGQFRQIATEMPNAKWVQYEPVNKDNVHEGARLAFGSPAHPVYRFDRAARILSLDADIFSGSNARYMADYAAGRKVTAENREINRMYAVETTMSLMGAKADHRIAVKPSQLVEVAKAIAAAFGVGGGAGASTGHENFIGPMVADLNAHRGRSLVIAGDHQPPVVHAIAHAINSALGNVGQTVTFIDPLAANTEVPQIEQLRGLITDIDAGAVKMLVILGGNPVYSTPADLKLDFRRVEGKVPLRIHLGLYYDETAEICHWHVPEKHFLEMWGDARAYDGTVTTIQPLIDPLYGGKSVYEIVQLFMQENFDKRDIDIVKEYWQAQNLTPAAAGASPASTPSPAQANGNAAAQPTQNGTAQAAATPAPAASPTPAQAAAAPASRAFEDNWRKVVHDGFIPNSAPAGRTMSANAAFLAEQQPAAAAQGEIEFTILPDPCIYDGRFANNGWMQELPNPLTKITWDNVGLISPATAARLEINSSRDKQEISGGERGIPFVQTKGQNMDADVVKISYQGGELDGVPMWVAPGQPDDVITLYMGYGRTRGGRIATPNNGSPMGYDVFRVQRSDAMTIGRGSIAKTGLKATIASTQIHFNMEGRDLLRVWDVNHLDHHIVDGEQHNEYDKTMYGEANEFYQKQYAENYKWAMSIDLNSCVGCNACVLACQAENNIPVVGKEQVERSREMHWLRIDTYYGGDDLNNPSGPYFQPIVCMQCEQAPCEVVCPVHATVHSPEGLNDMVYNRCVGTRYCSNNCPYKVRRFNFMLYQDWDTPQYKLMRNPEVTVRSRGVMEKCTYCTHRISMARIEAEKDGRKIQDGEVLTACQSVCPTGAIVFGDMNDPLSKIAQVKQDKRNYNLLNELNTQPRTTYMPDLKNPNPEMPGYTAPVFKKKTADKGKSDENGH